MHLKFLKGDSSGSDCEIWLCVVLFIIVQGGRVQILIYSLALPIFFELDCQWSCCILWKTAEILIIAQFVFY